MRSATIQSMTSGIPVESAEVAKAAKRWRVRMTVSALILTAILIGGSGNIGWAAAYAYVGAVLASQIGVYEALRRKWPDLLIERVRMQAGTKPWDKVIAPLIAIVLPFAIWFVAALDTRFGWSSAPWPWQALGWVLVAFGIVVMMWAMIVNRFFAATVRIQTERGHTVVSNGPYAYVRHPGYVGIITYMLGTALALDSAWALIPAALCAAVTVLRTALEDRTLRRELDGYADYALRVRWKLAPLLW